MIGKCKQRVVYIAYAYYSTKCEKVSFCFKHWGWCHYFANLQIWHILNKYNLKI